jgi:hypothetical protein
MIKTTSLIKDSVSTQQIRNRVRRSRPNISQKTDSKNIPIFQLCYPSRALLMTFSSTSYSLLLALFCSAAIASPPECIVTRGCPDCAGSFYIKAKDGKPLKLPMVTRKDDPLANEQLMYLTLNEAKESFDLLVRRGICSGTFKAPPQEKSNTPAKECVIRECMTTNCLFRWYLKPKDGSSFDDTKTFPRFYSVSDDLGELKNHAKEYQTFGYCKPGKISVLTDPPRASINTNIIKHPRYESTTDGSSENESGKNNIAK